jgi:hypothetical protein
MHERDIHNITWTSCQKIVFQTRHPSLLLALALTRTKYILIYRDVDDAKIIHLLLGALLSDKELPVSLVGPVAC